MVASRDFFKKSNEKLSVFTVWTILVEKKSSFQKLKENGLFRYVFIAMKAMIPIYFKSDKRSTVEENI